MTPHATTLSAFRPGGPGAEQRIHCAPLPRPGRLDTVLVGGGGLIAGIASYFAGT